MSYQIENDLNSFIQNSRLQRSQSLMANSTKATSLHHPLSNYGSQSEVGFYRPPAEETSVNPQVLRSLSPEDVQKMKYKIELDKQVAEKQQRRAHEWKKKIERDKRYVQHQSFGRHDRTTVLNKEELQEILTKGRAPSPVLEMPQQYPNWYQPPPPQQQPYTTETYAPNDNGPYSSPRQPPMNNYSQYPAYPPPPQPQAQFQSPPNNAFDNSSRPDFQRLYGPNPNANSNGTLPQGSNNTTQPIKGDAHDPFLLYDPNKEGQHVFNAIPQQDLYDPWGRPGAGAPLIHAPTGQKFTRYSGSLQEKLNHTGPLGFYGKQYSGDIDEQKRALELEQKRRQLEDMEHRSNAGDTAEWITQLERSRYPLKLHLPTTETTREITGARTRYRSDESRMLHNDLVRQAEERSQYNKLHRHENSLAELHHSESMNNWWGKGGGGAPSTTNRRHNVNSTFENPRQRWTTNHLGQMMMADDEGPGKVKLQQTDYYYPKTRQLSNHRNYYQTPEDHA